MKTYKGTCHCGAVSFSFKHEEVEKGLRCNCSICNRKGAVMSEFTIPSEEIDITLKNGELGLYQFDTKIAKHYFCKTCGIYPFHETMRKPGYYRVNLGCIDDININEIYIDVFDGQSI